MTTCSANWPIAIVLIVLTVVAFGLMALMVWMDRK
jgi:hypothetical protein